MIQTEFLLALIFGGLILRIEPSQCLLFSFVTLISAYVNKCLRKHILPIKMKEFSKQLQKENVVQSLEKILKKYTTYEASQSKDTEDNLLSQKPRDLDEIFRTQKSEADRFRDRLEEMDTIYSLKTLPEGCLTGK